MVNEQAFYETVGRLIREERKLKRLKQEHLAEAASISRVSITNIESGKQRVPLHTLVDIADSLNIPLEKLIPSEKIYYKAVKQRVDSKEIERLARTFFEDSETPD